MVGEITTQASGNGLKIFAQNTLQGIADAGTVFTTDLKFSTGTNFARKVTVVVYCTTTLPIFTFRITSPDIPDTGTIIFQSELQQDSEGRSTGEFFVREQDEFNVEWTGAMATTPDVLCLILN